VSRPFRSLRGWIYGGSVVFHAALALGAVLLPKQHRTETVAIELAEIKKKKDPPKPPPPPPPPAEEKPKPPTPQAAQAQAKVAPEAPKPEAPPPAPVGADGFADLGAVGVGGEGVPVAAAPRPAAAAAATAPPSATATTRKVQQLAPAGPEACSDPVVRPKRTIPVAPKYTMEARQAEIEGVVRVEVTVDETGHVVSARVLSGLGYGLDESALAAAKASVFEPATRCGKPVVGTVVLPFRFESI
jgi:protein TonB